MYKILFIPTATFVKMWAPERDPKDTVWKTENLEHLFGLLLNPVIQIKPSNWPSAYEFQANYVETCEIFIAELINRFKNIHYNQPDLFFTESLERQYYEIVEIP